MESVSLKDLKTYLKKVRDLEAMKYEQEGYVTFLSNKLYDVQNPDLHELKEYNESNFSLQHENGEHQSEGYGLGALCGAGVGVLVGGASNTWGGFLGGGILGLVLGLICIKINHKKKKKEYLERVLQEKNQIQKENEELQKQNMAIIGTSELQKSIISAELSLAEKEYAETCCSLKNYYDTDVIYGKYRGLVPVTMFCEYIESGLCDGLTGPNGAYRLYEEHIRMDRIIVQLDTVIARLNEIRDNQYMLANLISECQNELVSLKGVVNRQVDALQSIDSNTRMAAYHAQVAADNSEFQKWYTIFQHRNT